MFNLYHLKNLFIFRIHPRRPAANLRPFAVRWTNCDIGWPNALCLSHPTGFWISLWVVQERLMEMRRNKPRAIRPCRRRRRIFWRTDCAVGCRWIRRCRHIIGWACIKVLKVTIWLWIECYLKLVKIKNYNLQSESHSMGHIPAYVFKCFLKLSFI